MRDDGETRAVLQTAALLGEAEQVPRARLSLLTGLADERVDWRDPPLDDALREYARRERRFGALPTLKRALP